MWFHFLPKEVLCVLCGIPARNSDFSWVKQNCRSFLKLSYFNYLSLLLKKVGVKITCNHRQWMFQWNIPHFWWYDIIRCAVFDVVVRIFFFRNEVILFAPPSCISYFLLPTKDAVTRKFSGSNTSITELGTRVCSDSDNCYMHMLHGSNFSHKRSSGIRLLVTWKNNEVIVINVLKFMDIFKFTCTFLEIHTCFFKLHMHHGCDLMWLWCSTELTLFLRLRYLSKYKMSLVPHRPMLRFKIFYAWDCMTSIYQKWNFP